MIQIGTIIDIKVSIDKDIPSIIGRNYRTVGFPSEVLITIIAVKDSIQTEYEFRELDITSHAIEKYIGISGTLFSDNDSVLKAERFEAEFEIDSDPPDRVLLPRLVSISSNSLIEEENNPKPDSKLVWEPIVAGSGIVQTNSIWPERTVAVSGTFFEVDTIYGIGTFRAEEKEEAPVEAKPIQIVEVNNRKRKFKI